MSKLAKKLNNWKYAIVSKIADKLLPNANDIEGSNYEVLPRVIAKLHLNLFPMNSVGYFGEQKDNENYVDAIYLGACLQTEENKIIHFFVVPPGKMKGFCYNDYLIDPRKFIKETLSQAVGTPKLLILPDFSDTAKAGECRIMILTESEFKGFYWFIPKKKYDLEEMIDILNKDLK